MPPESGTSRFEKAAQIRRAERTLHKDLRFMIRRNEERRRSRAKGPGGNKLPDEFKELRRAKLDVSIESAALVRKEFGMRAALPFAARTALRVLAHDFVPGWAARLLRSSGGRKNQSRHDEGGRAEEPRQGQPGHRGQRPSAGPRRAAVSHDEAVQQSDGWASAAVTPTETRTAYTAVAIATLTASIADLKRWYDTEPDAMNRTRELFSTAEEQRAWSRGPVGVVDNWLRDQEERPRIGQHEALRSAPPRSPTQTLGGPQWQVPSAHDFLLAQNQQADGSRPGHDVTAWESGPTDRSHSVGAPSVRSETQSRVSEAAWTRSPGQPSEPARTPTPSTAPQQFRIPRKAIQPRSKG